MSHPEKSSYFSTRQVTHYNVTNWAGNPLQYTIIYWPVTHYNIPSYTGQVTHYNVTIWAGNPLQYTITKKNPHIFQSLDRSPGTIRPLAKFFAFLLSLGRLPKTIWSISNKKKQKKNKKQKTKNKKKWVVFQITCSLCKSHMSIYCFRSFQDSKKKKEFFPYLLFFINLQHKAKENEIFQYLCIVNIIKRGQLS